MKIKHTALKNGIPVYQRRVPSDLKARYDGAEFMPRWSLAGLSPADMARKVAAINKEVEDEWARLRSGVQVTPATLRDAVDARIKKWIGRRPGEPLDKLTPGEAEVLEDEVDWHLLNTYGDDYHRLPAQGHDTALKETVSSFDYALYHRAGALRMPERADRKLSDALELYLTEKGASRKPKANLGTRCSLKAVYDAVGDLPLVSYTRAHAREVRDKLLNDGLTTTSVRRRLNDIRAVFNKGIREFELGNLPNPFHHLEIPNLGEDADQRLPFSLAELRLLYAACRKSNDEARWVIALMMGTGARLSEILGLRSEDVFLTDVVPHIWIRPHKDLGHSVKTDRSKRKVPLVGPALWAAEAAMKPKGWLFPKYASDTEIKSNSASAALLKWIGTVPGIAEGKVNHSFRHTITDLLRNVNVPEEIIARIVGHTTRGMTAKYGDGHSLEILKDALERALADIKT